MASDSLKKVALLGSAFDPLHFGHIALARMALHETHIDEVWLLPCPDRWDKNTIANAEQRLKWAHSAAEEEKRKGFPIEASGFEIQNGFRGTYLTLKSLCQAYPNFTFCLILGFDSFLTLPGWRDSSTQTLNGLKILEEFELIVSPRLETHPTLPAWAHEHIKNIHFLKSFSQSTAPLADLGDAQFLEKLSSSEIRKAIKLNIDNPFSKKTTFEDITRDSLIIYKQA